MITDQDYQMCLQKLLSPNNQERGLAEKTLHNFASSHPSEYVQCAMDLISNSQIPENVKVSNLIFMRKTIPVGKTKLRIFLVLQKALRENLKIFLLKSLSENQNVKIRNMIGDLISDIASSLYNEKQGILADGEKWEDLFKYLKDLFSTGQKLNILAVFQIIKSIIDQTEEYMQIHKEDLIKLLEFGFKQEDYEIKLSSYKTLSTLVQCFQPQIVKKFKVFQFPFLNFVELTFQNKNEDLIKEVLSELFDVCANSANFVKKYYPQIFIVMSKVRDMNLDEDQDMKIEAVDCLINFVRNYPDLATKKEQIVPLLEIIFKNMLEIEDEVNQEWCSPPDGFNDDLVESDDQKIVKQSMSQVDTLFHTLDIKVLKPIVFEYIEKMLSTNNWKYIHAAIMTISQIAEYIGEDDENDLKNMIQILSQQKNHQNPRVRYSICHALGQLANDQSPHFQDEYFKVYFEIVIPYLQDPVPRVVAHALASLTNFLESADETIIKEYYQVLLNAFLYHLDKSIVFVKEAVLSALSAFAEGFQESFAGQYDSVVQLIFNIFAYQQKKEFKQLVSNAMETITIMGSIYGYEKFQPYIERVIAELIKIQNSRNSQEHLENDTQLGYILSAWQRMIMFCDDKLAPYIDQILPSLLESIKKPLMEITEEDSAFNTTVTEGMELALQMLSLFMKHYSANIGKYLQEIYGILNLMNIKIKNKDVQISAFSLLPNLIKVAKSIQGFDYKSLSKQIFANLWEKFIEEKDSGVKGEYCYFIQDVLKFGGEIFSVEELQQFLLKVEQELQKSEQRRKDFILNIDEEEEVDQQVVEEQKAMENEYEDQFKLEIANLFGKMFMSHKQKSIPLFEYLYIHHIQPCLSNPTDINIEYAIYLIVDAIEYLSEFLPPQTIMQFYKHIIGYTKYNNYEVRQSAIYGVGLIAQKLNPNDFKPVFTEVVQIIIEFLNEQAKEMKGEMNYSTCRENFVSALGKCMKSQWSQITKEDQQKLFDIWFKELPIDQDHLEGQQMHAFLTELVQNSQEIALGNNFSNLLRVIDVYAKVYNQKKISTPQVNHTIYNQMKSIIQNQQIVALLQRSTLTDKQKGFLEKINQAQK